MTGPTVSILLVSWNTAPELARCLAALPGNGADGITYEILAVDNASKDDSAAVLAAHPDVSLTRNDRNRGFAAAVNQAYRRARGDFVLLLNSDVEMHRGALAGLVSFLVDRPDAAGVSPRYEYPDGRFQQHYVNFPSLPAAIALVTGLKRVPFFRRELERFTMRDGDFSRPRRLASGSCMLLRRSALPAGDLMDERFPIYWNDAILARGLFGRGKELWMIPDVAVTHSRGASCRLLGPAIRQRHLVGSLVGYISVTRGQRHVQVLRGAAIADHIAKRILGRPTSLGWTDLRAAMRGESGPLPDGDTRVWSIIVDREPLRPGRLTTPVAKALADGRRVVYLGPEPRRGLRAARVVRAAPDLWILTPGVGLPTAVGRRAASNWNRWAAGAHVRRLLDREAGARVLHLRDPLRKNLVGTLGEDSVDRAGDPRESTAG